jgi:uncharacterized protein
MADLDLSLPKSIALIGASRDSSKPSNLVLRYLVAHGFTVYPVNPSADSIEGLKCFPSLLEIPFPIDIVDIFRPSADVPAIVEQAIKKKAKAIWMQEGIVNEAAAGKARAAGLSVVMDRCIMKEHRRLG